MFEFTHSGRLRDGKHDPGNGMCQKNLAKDSFGIPIARHAFKDDDFRRSTYGHQSGFPFIEGYYVKNGSYIWDGDPRGIIWSKIGIDGKTMAFPCLWSLPYTSKTINDNNEIIEIDKTKWFFCKCRSTNFSIRKIYN